MPTIKVRVESYRVSFYSSYQIVSIDKGLVKLNQINLPTAVASKSSVTTFFSKESISTAI